MYCLGAVTDTTTDPTVIPPLGDHLQQWESVFVFFCFFIHKDTFPVNIPPVSTTESSLSQTRPEFVNQW